jgi:hypothetical protein
LKELHLPGVYALAISEVDLTGSAYSLIPEIKYFGMTNAKKGLASRLNQFNNVINDINGHGGAWRFRFDFPEGTSILPLLFVSVAPFPCNVTTNQPDDLRLMGKVCEFEYACFADYVHAYKSLPKYNDKKKSPKMP